MMFVGHLGADALAGAGLGNLVSYFTMRFFITLPEALKTLVSNAYGAKEYRQVCLGSMVPVVDGACWSIVSVGRSCLIVGGGLGRIPQLARRFHGFKCALLVTPRTHPVVQIGTYFQRSLVINVLSTVPITVLWFLAEPILVAIGQPAEVASKAGS